MAAETLGLLSAAEGAIDRAVRALTLFIILAGCQASTTTLVHNTISSTTSTALSSCANTGADAPLDPNSPWPKFRYDLSQTGRAETHASTTGGSLWAYQTGNGVFSSPVIDGAGNVYIGSADGNFYAFDHHGNLKWTVPTAGIIDSSALLDDQQQVYFGAGDGYLRAANTQNGSVVWKFAAEAPAVNHAFINWFEGNVAMGCDGTLYAPNDNFAVYAINRGSGSEQWKWLMNDQTWSSPALSLETGNLFIGNNYLAASWLIGLFWKNTFALGSSGNLLWRQGVQASISASPLLTNVSGQGQMVVGAFDGYLRAYQQSTGNQVWSVPTNDHLYASPARLSDGTLIQPSTDGSIYAFSASDGSTQWTFDTLEPFRSSPAVDGDDLIYVGGGDGRLYVLNPGGSLRWSMLLSSNERDSLNSSPALGPDAVVIGCESGEVFSVPYDYCLLPGINDGRCTVGPGPGLPSDGVFLYYTSPLGHIEQVTPATIPANTALAFSLVVRNQGHSELALIDEATLQVTTLPPTNFTVEVSGNRRFLTITPTTDWGRGSLQMNIQGEYLESPTRNGLLFTGGVAAGQLAFSQTFNLATGSDSVALLAPGGVGNSTEVIEMSRIAAPLPTILPSYNQIGFDSLDYLMSPVEATNLGATVWVVGATIPAGGGQSVVDPNTQVMFPFTATMQDGVVTMQNNGGFTVDVMQLTLPFDAFRVSAITQGGAFTGLPSLSVRTNCGNIPTYGPFLANLGFCNPSSDELAVFGSALLTDRGPAASPANVGQVSFNAKTGGLLSSPSVTATLSGSGLQLAEHAVSILLINADSSEPVSLNYGLVTNRQAASGGTLEQVTLTVDPGKRPANARAWLMVDTAAVAGATLTWQ